MECCLLLLFTILVRQELKGFVFKIISIFNMANIIIILSLPKTTII